MAPNRFWMLFNSDGKHPKKRQGSLEIATTEAKRLAEKHPGSKVYVLEALGYVSTGEAQEGGVFGPVEMKEF